MTMLATPTHAADDAVATCGTPTPAELADFFDATLPGRLNEDRVPGAVVSVVADGSMTFARGYGLADVDRGVPFDPDRSLVRIASITKLFTWTAVMQQVEAGRLDLDADVNRYLTSFQIPSTFPEPVTLRTLMNHTAGFEDRVIGTGARTAADVPALSDYLASNMPARIRPPGTVSAYSNYGAALAGYIVAQVSGEPYERYIQTHLFGLLSMNRSTASEPVPPPLSGDLARSYDSDADPLQAIPFTFDTMAPDGAISSTATDMARFMITHLDEGASPVLGGPSMSRMHERSFSADPRLGGYAHGFMDRTINGHRVLMHDGSWEGFLSALILVPDCGLGLFLSTNGTGGVATVTELVAAFFDRFAPETRAPAAVPGPATTPLRPAEPRAGFYKPTRHNESTIEKLVTLLGPMRLTVDTGGIVHFKGKQWSSQGNGLFRAVDGTDQLVFLAGPDGQRYVATDGPAYQLMPPGETLTVNLAVLLGFAFLALTAMAVPLARFRNRTRTPARAWRLARSLTVGATGLGLVFLALLLAQLLGDTGDFLYGVPVGFTILLGLPIVVLLLAAAGLVLTAASWRAAAAGLTARIHQVTLLVGLSTLVWFLWQWNLVGWQFS
jgi:CubicO group peptidase (beta-lactamase class C family)